MKSSGSKRRHLFTSSMITALLGIMFLFIVHSASGEYAGEFVSGESKAGDPGDTLDLDITFRNTGNQETTFTLHDPDLPEDWEFEWPGGNSTSLSPESSTSLSLAVTVSDNHQYARAGWYGFDITGEFDTDTDPEPMVGGALLEVYVNVIHGIEVRADELSGFQAGPGKDFFFQVQVTNTGNSNDSYMFDFTKEDGPSDGASWFSVLGQPHGNDILIPMDDTTDIDIGVSVPVFSEENDDAVAGIYQVELTASSRNDSDAKKQLICEFEVEPWYNPQLTITQPEQSMIVHPSLDTIVDFTPTLTNAGNTADEIRVSVPASEFTGEKEGWEVTIDQQSEPVYNLDILVSEQVTMEITVDNATAPGHYTLTVEARSIGNESRYQDIVLIINLSEPVIAVELTGNVTHVIQVDPMHAQEVEYGFIIENIGNIADSYQIAVETPLHVGPYMDWMIELQDKQGERHQGLIAPSGLSGNHIDGDLTTGASIGSSLYIIPSVNASSGLYEEIHLSVASMSDPAKVWNIAFSLEVIRSDLTVYSDPDEFYISPASDIELGDPVDVYVEVHNVGEADSHGFDVWFYSSRSLSQDGISGGYMAMRTVQSLPSGDQITLHFTLDALDVGRNDLFVHVDKPITSGPNQTHLFGEPSPVGRIHEDDESNNEATLPSIFHVEIDHSPDLSLDSVNVSSMTAGEGSVITVTLMNRSPFTIPAGYASLQVNIDDIPLPDRVHGSPHLSLDAMGPNATLEIHYDWAIPPLGGTYNLTVLLQVPLDSHHEDNQETIPLTITGNATFIPKILIKTLRIRSLNGTELYLGDDMEINVTVVNEGNRASNITCVVSLKMDPPSELLEVNASLEPGQTLNLSHVWNPSSRGEYTIVAEISHMDPEDDDDSDNRKEITFTIKRELPDLEDSSFLPFSSPLSIVFILFFTACAFRKRIMRDE